MFRKLQNVASNRKVQKLGAVFMCMMICCATLVPMAFAVDGTATVSEPTYKEAATLVYEEVHNVINFSNILDIILVGLGGMATLYLLWWGIRKVIKMLKSGLNGKLKA